MGVLSYLCHWVGRNMWGKGKSRFFFGIIQKDCVLTMFLAAQKSDFEMHRELFDYNALDRYSGF